VVLHDLVREMDGAHNENLLENGGFMTLPPFAGGPGRNLRSAEATKTHLQIILSLQKGHFHGKTTKFSARHKFLYGRV